MQEAQLPVPSAALALTLGRPQACPFLGIGSPYVGLAGRRMGRARRGSGFGGFARLSWVCPAQGRAGPVATGRAKEPCAEEVALSATARLLKYASSLSVALTRSLHAV